MRNEIVNDRSGRSRRMRSTTGRAVSGLQADRLEAVAARDGAPVRGLARPADPDRDLVRGLRQHADLVELVVLAVEARGVVTPARAQQVDDLVGRAAAVVEVVPERDELGFRPSHADGDREPTVAQAVEARERVRELERVVLRQHEHARAEADRASSRRPPTPAS